MAVTKVPGLERSERTVVGNLEADRGIVGGGCAVSGEAWGCGSP